MGHRPDKGGQGAVRIAHPSTSSSATTVSQSSLSYRAPAVTAWATLPGTFVSTGSVPRSDSVATSQSRAVAICCTRNRGLVMSAILTAACRSEFSASWLGVGTQGVPQGLQMG